MTYGEISLLLLVWLCASVTSIGILYLIYFVSRKRRAVEKLENIIDLEERNYLRGKDEIIAALKVSGAPEWLIDRLEGDKNEGE